jgi:hypothetical protein
MGLVEVVFAALLTALFAGAGYVLKILIVDPIFGIRSAVADVDFCSAGMRRSFRLGERSSWMRNDTGSSRKLRATRLRSSRQPMFPDTRAFEVGLDSWP